MPAPITTADLKTTIKNISGAARKFTFLPPHGLDLAAGEEVVYAGDVVAAINQAHTGRAAKRRVDALLASLQAQDIAIVSGPKPILWDDTLEETRVIQVDNGTIDDVRPSWNPTTTTTTSTTAAP